MNESLCSPPLKKAQIGVGVLEVARFPKNRSCEPRFLRNRSTSNQDCQDGVPGKDGRVINSDGDGDVEPDGAILHDQQRKLPPLHQHLRRERHARGKSMKIGLPGKLILC